MVPVGRNGRADMTLPGCCIRLNMVRCVYPPISRVWSIYPAGYGTGTRNATPEEVATKRESVENNPHSGEFHEAAVQRMVVLVARFERLIRSVFEIRSVSTSVAMP